MADDDFSREVKKDFADEIKASENFFYELKLGIGKCKFLELEDVVEDLYKAMELVHKQRARFMRSKGCITRFFITYDSSTYLYEPFFKLIMLSKNKNEAELYKLKLQSYQQWFKILCFLHQKFDDDVVVKLEPLENENAEQIIQDFFKQPTIGAGGLIDEEERKLILKTHRTVSLGGVFKEIKRNRHVSVEE